NLPAEETQAAGPTTVAYAETKDLNDGSLYLRVTPGDMGDNDIMISVMDADDDPIELVDDPEVKLSLESQDIGPISSDLEAESDDPGHYGGTVKFPADGDWTIDVVTRVSKFEEPI